jgi:alanyl-tRNA synthetase
VDQEAYQIAWEKHQAVSAGGLGLQGVDEVFQSVLSQKGPTEFAGYQSDEGEGEIAAILEIKAQKDEKGQSRITDRKQVEEISAGRLAELVVSPTPFYGETGGQVGDTGRISAEGFEAEVVDAIRPLPELIVLRVQVKQGTVRTGSRVLQAVDPERRQAIRLNHSATHLLHAGLRKVLGKHVNQKGSLVAPDRLRFDFSHIAPLKQDEIVAVEKEVNRLIRANYPVEVRITDLEGARQAGATMLFGEKYDEQVRMVQMGDQSLELCGGTHTDRTGDIGVFKIVSEGSVQAGVRRIEALTGTQALLRFQNLEHQAQKAAEVLKAAPAQLLERLSSLADRERRLIKEIDDLKQQVAASGSSKDPIEDAREISGIKVLAIPTRGIQLAGLRDFADKQRDRMGGGVVMAFAIDRDKLSAVCSVSKDLTKRLRAGDLLKQILQLTGGKGGGRPDFAQGGGGDPALLDKAIEAFYPMVERALENKA